MDRSSNPPTTREASCPAHGDYVAENVCLGYWTRCPACDREQKAQEAAQKIAREAAEARERVARRLDQSGLQGRFLRSTFETFVATTPAQRRALATCRTFAEDFDAGVGGGLWLIGPPGTGKTHLGSAIVNHLIRVGEIPARIHAVHELMAMARARIGGRVRGSAWGDRPDESADEFIENLARAPLLVLDEIGVSRGSDWETEQLFALVDTRYKFELPTVVVSNLTAPQLKTELGHRLFDRLREGAQVVPMDWASFRGPKP